MGWFLDPARAGRRCRARAPARCALLARHEFQGGAQNYRDLVSQRNPRQWSDKPGRVRRHARQLAGKATVSGCRRCSPACGQRVAGLRQRRDALAVELAAAESRADGLDRRCTQRRDRVEGRASTLDVHRLGDPPAAAGARRAYQRRADLGARAAAAAADAGERSSRSPDRPCAFRKRIRRGHSRGPAQARSSARSRWPSGRDSAPHRDAGPAHRRAAASALARTFALRAAGRAAGGWRCAELRAAARRARPTTWRRLPLRRHRLYDRATPFRPGGSMRRAQRVQCCIAAAASPRRPARSCAANRRLRPTTAPTIATLLRALDGGGARPRHPGRSGARHRGMPPVPRRRTGAAARRGDTPRRVGDLEMDRADAARGDNAATRPATAPPPEISQSPLSRPASFSRALSTRSLSGLSSRALCGTDRPFYQPARASGAETR